MEKTISTFCHNCQSETKQEVLFQKGELTTQEYISFGPDDKRGESVWTIEGRIWKVSSCNGCEKVNLNVFQRNDPAKDDILIHQFPQKVIRNIPYWVSFLNLKYIQLFAEVYGSLNSGHIRLPLMGARTLLDIFIVEKIGDIGSFKSKLQKLRQDGYISEASRELLDVALEYGNAAIHRGYEAEKEEIMGVMDIIENLLQTEALKDQTMGLKKSIPKK